MIDRNKVIAVAMGEIGYKEKASNAYLDDFTANAGNGNYTKYARDLDAIPGFYNGPKNGYDWCDCFADWCYVRAYGLPLGLQLICQPTESAGAGCVHSAQYYMSAGRYFQQPEPGDQIFFDYGGGISHTGIVVEVNNYAIITVEGNVNGGVVQCSYPKDTLAIHGFGRPCWELYDEPEAEPIPQPVTDAIEVSLPLVKYGDTGLWVKVMQTILIGKGFSCGRWGADGEYGIDTKIGLYEFQKANGLTTDFICDADDWQKLLSHI